MLAIHVSMFCIVASINCWVNIQQDKISMTLQQENKIPDKIKATDGGFVYKWGLTRHEKK